MDCTVKDLTDRKEVTSAVYATLRQEVRGRAALTFLKEAEAQVDVTAVIALALTKDVTVTQDLTAQKESAYWRIDKAAAACDLKYTTTGGQMAAIYRGKLAHCDKWLADGSPADVSGTGYGYIRAEMKRLAELGQPAAAADAVAAMQGVGLQWEDTLAEKREEFRGVGKAKVKNATDLATLEAAATEAITSLQAL